MHLDVLDLKSFYYRTRLGRAAQKAIRAQMQRFWPEAARQTVVGFGFALPLLRPYLAEARRVTALMPGPQGVMSWPAGMPNVSVLCEETSWPVQTGQVDKLVLLHGLETSENPHAVLEEAHRVLGPGGSAVFIVPNRGGLWARRDRTPFGFGRPYSPGQLEAQIGVAGFRVVRRAAALYQPPSERRFWLRTGGMWEGLGQFVSGRHAGGVLMVEATKHVAAPSGGAREAVRKPVLAPVREGSPA